MAMTRFVSSLVATDRLRSFATITLALVATACATLADAESGGDNLPNAGAGPFRALRSDEVGNLRSAPNVLVDDETFPRDPAILDIDGDLSTPAVVGYFSLTPKVPMTEPDPATPSRAIVRYDALDGRSFQRASLVVLVPEHTWEGASFGAPSVLRVGSEIFLYYAAEGGIGLARTNDGVAFNRLSVPVLGANADTNTWEKGNPPANPGVVFLDDGTFLMFYDVLVSPGVRKIGEARSKDGLTWERVLPGPALEPRPDTNPNDPNYDGVSVEAPNPVLGRTSEGRPMLRVYYEAHDALGRRTIGLAARYDVSQGALDRAIGPVFSGSLGPGQPWVDVRPGYSLLFVTQTEGRSKSEQIPAVAAAISPADAVLPARTQ
jgi:hypothetical protein